MQSRYAFGQFSDFDEITFDAALSAHNFTIFERDGSISACTIDMAQIMAGNDRLLNW